MDDKMSLIIEPTLQSMTSTAIVIHMWSKDDVKALTPKPELLYLFEENVETRMREKVKKIPIPNRFKKELSVIIEPIGNHINDWYRYLYHEFQVQRIKPKELRWTNKGTIDFKKSALVLANNQSLDVVSRYKLACTFCLTNEIAELMQDIPEDALNELAKNGSRKLVAYWTCFLRDKTEELQSIISEEDDEDQALSHEQFAFKCAVFDTNAVAAEFFFAKLSPAEVKTMLDWHAEEALDHHFTNPQTNVPTEFFRVTVYFFLSRMNRDQRGMLLRNCAESLLMSLLEWPYQRLFLETFDRVWQFISKYNFVNLLFELVFELDCNTCDARAVYEELFKQFWRSGPLEYRAFAVNDRDFRNIIYSSFKLERKKVMGNVADVVESDSLFKFCGYQCKMCKKIYNFLKFFLEECVSCEEQMVKIEKLMTKRDSLKEEFFQILDTVL